MGKFDALVGCMVVLGLVAVACSVVWSIHRYHVIELQERAKVEAAAIQAGLIQDTVRGEHGVFWVKPSSN